MALYNGFFDFSAQVLEETGVYDREYNAGDFVEYFASFLGSGVCVYQNPDSMKVTIESGRLLVSPGYLFLQGYWLANRAEEGEDPASYRGYWLDLPASGTYAVAARLDLSRSWIELTVLPQAESYPDCLVLALADADNGTVTDTRGDMDLCGLVDALGDLSSKVVYAVNYIDNEIEDRLKEAEAQIAAQDARLDQKIREVAAQVKKIIPPPIGTVQYTASQNIGEEWLRCDGSFITEADYPELVQVLGKLAPSGDKFELLSDGEIGAQISNGALFAGRMWVYSYSTKKLYGVDTAGELPVKEVALESQLPQFQDFIIPTTENPLCLSILPHANGEGARLFLTQIIRTGREEGNNPSDLSWLSYFLIFSAEFTGEEASLNMELPFTKIGGTVVNNSFRTYRFDPTYAVPYVSSHLEGGKEIYTVYAGRYEYSNYIGSLKWEDAAEGEAATATPYEAISQLLNGNIFQRMAYSHKSKGELVGVENNTNSRYYIIASAPNQFFTKNRTSSYLSDSSFRSSFGPLNVCGGKVVVSFDKGFLNWYPIETNTPQHVAPNVALPPSSRVFVDGGAYLWGKDIYLFFVGTGLLFSRSLEAGSFGYLDTTSILGTITQFGYLDYAVDEGTLYLLGQDTANQVKVAKIVLNTLYDYANDGAWLPLIASDGVPAYIKAKAGEAEEPGPEEPGENVLTVTVRVPGSSGTGDFPQYYAAVLINGETMTEGTYQYKFPTGEGKIAVGLRVIDAPPKSVILQGNGASLTAIPANAETGTQHSVTLDAARYLETGLQLYLHFGS